MINAAVGLAAVFLVVAAVTTLLIRLLVWLERRDVRRLLKIRPRGF